MDNFIAALGAPGETPSLCPEHALKLVGTGTASFAKDAAYSTSAKTRRESIASASIDGDVLIARRAF